MNYHSTRSREKLFSSKEAILQGLCEDGGLFVSDDILSVQIPTEDLTGLSYEEILLRVFRALLPDYTEEEFSDCAGKAYHGKFETEELTPVTEIGDRYLLELYHGPTQAFKDMALCMLPLLMSKALSGTGKELMIVTATSGDTGKAALSGFSGAPGIGITVFYPYGKVSDIQYLQMATEEGKNCFVSAVEGNFDTCQTGVKEIFGSSPELSLSSANSINVGRLVPQIVYYFEAYKALLLKGVITPGEKISFCVPTGNFGDILAGYYAKMMGLPVEKLIIASNENKVLYDFMKTGTYDRNREFVKTISPSMDILISSNLERYLYYASGCDCDYVKGLMKDLKENGKFTVSEKVLADMRETFDAGFATNEESKAAIRKAYEKDGRLIDPHTAVGYKVSDGRPGITVILSTASPYKFAKDVYESIFGTDLSGDGFAYMKALSEKTGEKIPAALRALSEKPVLHKSVIRASEMKDFVKDSIERLKALE